MTVCQYNGFTFNVIDKCLYHTGVMDHSKHIAHPLIVFCFVYRCCNRFIHVFLQVKTWVSVEAMGGTYMKLSFLQKFYAVIYSLRNGIFMAKNNVLTPVIRFNVA